MHRTLALARFNCARYNRGTFARGGSMQAMYTATATATGEGRNGPTESEDGLLSVDVRIPKEMGGPGGATNPEQLFAAGYAACFHSALKAVARAEKADVDGAQVSATVSIGRRP